MTMMTGQHNIWSSHPTVTSALYLQYRTIGARHRETGRTRTVDLPEDFLALKTVPFTQKKTTVSQEQMKSLSTHQKICGEIDRVDGAVSTTNILCKHFCITEGTVTHGIDNAAVLRNIFGPDEPDTTMPCFHLIKRVRRKIADLPVTWIGKKSNTSR